METSWGPADLDVAHCSTALGHAPDAEKVTVPWRLLGRSYLTPEVLTRRLEEYLAALFDRYG